MKRIFLHQDSQAGVFHCTSRFLDRVRHFASAEAKDHFMKIVRAYEDLLGVGSQIKNQINSRRFP
jgi:hypothetical protein